MRQGEEPPSGTSPPPRTSPRPRASPPPAQPRTPTAVAIGGEIISTPPLFFFYRESLRKYTIVGIAHVTPPPAAIATPIAARQAAAPAAGVCAAGPAGGPGRVITTTWPCPRQNISAVTRRGGPRNAKPRGGVAR